MGEPGGIGPEIIVKALGDKHLRLECLPVVVGDRAPLEAALRLLKSRLKIRVIEGPEQAVPVAVNSINLIELGALKGFTKGKPTAGGGRASYEYIKKAVRLALDKKVDAICTAPISKEALSMAGVPFAGHTEMLASLTKSKDYAMMLVGGPLRVLLVTTHVALADVPALVTKKSVLKKIALARKAARMLGLEKGGLKASIAVCGLNPHAGEAGLFGREEMEEIAPAVKEARRRGINASGPHPPDTLFRKAYLGEVDIVVAMYHDQGLIPLKMIAFEEGVNITVGLPVIRTSPGHGTAYGIAWKAKADARGMKEAIRTALRLRSPSAG